MKRRSSLGENARQNLASDGGELKDQEANVPEHGTRSEQAEARTDQAEARTEQAEARTEQAEARIEQAVARTEQAEARTEQAEARIEQAVARTERAKARTDQAVARTEQAEGRTQQVKMRSEQAIRASELSYRRLFEAAQDGILILDIDTGRISDVNPFLIELLGFSHSEMVGKTVGELSPFKDIESNKAMLDRLQKYRYVRYEDLPLETRANRRVAVEFVSNVYQVGDKKVIQCNIRDITVRKHAEEEIRRLHADLERRVIERTAQLQMANVDLRKEMAERKHAQEGLRQSEERFGLLVGSVQDYAILMLSPQGNVVSWNKGAERIKGYRGDEIIGKHFSCFYTPEAIAQGTPERELQTALEQGRFEGEGWRLRKVGQPFWANVVITAVFDKEGCLQGFAKITRDMTDAKRLEQTLHDKNIELKNAAEAKDRFLANMSHELRTPLNGIIGFAELLVDGKPGAVNPKQTEYLNDILDSGKHLLQLISDILDLAKVGAGKMDLNPEKFLLAKAIEEVCAVTKPIAQKKSIHIEVNVAPEIGDVTLDQQKFKQVLYNLLSNAIKFSHDGGKVEIRAQPHGTDRFKLVVNDAGIGIEAEDVGRLFKEFEQLESGASRHHEGTGLGLALARKIVELQGGTIGVESEVSRGSSFTVALPMVMAEASV